MPLPSLPWRPALTLISPIAASKVLVWDIMPIITAIENCEKLPWKYTFNTLFYMFILSDCISFDKPFLKMWNLLSWSLDIYVTLICIWLWPSCDLDLANKILFLNKYRLLITRICIFSFYMMLTVPCCICYVSG